MANGRNKIGRKGDSGRDAGAFVALPWTVLDCTAYARLSHPARSLLLEIARQFVRDNNGRLLCGAAYLAKRGWKSNDVIARAKVELLGAGFIHETCKGHRPNKASWYAVTWRALDRFPGYDVGALETFKRGAYAELAIGAIKPTRQELYEKHRQAGNKNASLTPSHGAVRPPTAPSHGVESMSAAPSHGAVGGVFGVLPTPSHGHHLDIPSSVQLVPCTRIGIDAVEPTDREPQKAISTLAELWGTVGCKSQWTTPHPARLNVARAAMRQASDRHTRKPPGKPSRLAVRVGDDGVTRERDEFAQDLSAWD
ncbi:MAG: hypothetical protein ABIP34_07825 [Rhodoferax sp.]|uniref:hypothetical protein n=1 Tax=Rhodoferax sp. TaxID=50421 RepID=UPI0032675165